MPRTTLVLIFLSLVSAGSIALLIRASGTQAKPDRVVITTPTLKFTRFEETHGVPVAQLTLTNTTKRPIYFAGYGSHRPLQTWELRVGDQWTMCDYEWCGTGRSNFSLAPNDSIMIETDLREYRTAEMPEDAPLSAFTKPMRVVLYYGHAENDIQHAIFGEPFQVE
ncbi:MAG: hypothetical protein AAFU85_26395 [Planctomycetota bacterium]